MVIIQIFTPWNYISRRHNKITTISDLGYQPTAANITAICRPLSTKMLNEKGSKVHPIHHLRVKGAIDDAYLGGSHSPGVALSKK